MTVRIDQLGWWADSNKVTTFPGRVVLQRTDGTTILVVPEFNASQPYAINSAYGNGGGNNAIKIYQLMSGGNTINHRATIDVAGILDTPAEIISADLYSDDSIGVVYQKDSGAVKYNKISSSWVVGATESIANIGTNLYRVDMSVSPIDSTIVSLIRINTTTPKVEVVSYHRKAAGGAWVNLGSKTLINTADPSKSMTDLAVQIGKGGSSASRPVVITATSGEQGGTDNGFRVFTSTLDEVNSAMTTPTLRATYLAGDMNETPAPYSRRGYVWATGATEFTFAYMQATKEKHLLVARATFDGTTWTEVIAPQQSKASATVQIQYRFAASYANDVVNFYYMGTAGTPVVINYIGRIDRTANTVAFSGAHRWEESEERYGILSGTGRNADTVLKHTAITLNKTQTGLWAAWTQDNDPPLVPTTVTPATGSIVTTSAPIVSMRARLGKDYAQSRHKGVWQVARDAAFTTSVNIYVQPDSKFQKIDNTRDATKYTVISDTLPTTIRLTQGTWYIRAALEDEFRIRTAWSSAESFDVQVTSGAAGLKPSNGEQVAWNGGQILFSWEFNSDAPGDSETAFQIVVTRDDTGAVVLDTGKVVSTALSYLGTLPAGLEDIPLSWKIRPWNIDDTPGNYSASATFYAASEPTVAITYPAANGTVNSAVPKVTFVPTIAGARYIVTYQVIITQGPDTIYDSGAKTVNLLTGQSFTHTADQPYLDNAENYTVKVIVTDNTDLVATSPPIAFSTAWAPPAAPGPITVNSTYYSDESKGYVSITWGDANRDADFAYWLLSRKDDYYENGVLTFTGTYKPVGKVYTTATSYVYHDYSAPSGYTCTYKLSQVVDRTGSLVESINNPTATTTTPASEGYWLIEELATESPSTAFRLMNVVQDDYTVEYEEAEYVIAGRGRHVDRGDRLGYKGTLVAQLRSGGGTSARYKKLRVEELQRNNANLYLRSPFGDVFPIYVGSVQVGRIAGTGKSEFCDVTIPYTEVAY